MRSTQRCEATRCSVGAISLGELARAPRQPPRDHPGGRRRNIVCEPSSMRGIGQPAAVCRARVSRWRQRRRSSAVEHHSCARVRCFERQDRAVTVHVRRALRAPRACSVTNAGLSLRRWATGDRRHESQRQETCSRANRAHARSCERAPCHSRSSTRAQLFELVPRARERLVHRSLCAGGVVLCGLEPRAGSIARSSAVVALASIAAHGSRGCTSTLRGAHAVAGGGVASRRSAGRSRCVGSRDAWCSRAIAACDRCAIAG